MISHSKKSKKIVISRCDLQISGFRGLSPAKKQENSDLPYNHYSDPRYFEVPKSLFDDHLIAMFLLFCQLLQVNHFFLALQFALNFQIVFSCSNPHSQITKNMLTSLNGWLDENS